MLKQEILGRTNYLLSFDIWTAKKKGKKSVAGDTDTNILDTKRTEQKTKKNWGVRGRWSHNPPNKNIKGVIYNKTDSKVIS
jgi:hypothetical protein